MDDEARPRRRRVVDLIYLFLAVALIGGSAVMYVIQSDRIADQRAADQAKVNEELAERDQVITGLVTQLATVVTQLATLSTAREADRLAFELKVCVYGNDAKRTAREDTAAAFDVAIETWMEYLRRSPHSDPALIDEAEAVARDRIAAVLSTPELKDHDCNGDGVIGDAGDYP